MRNRLLITSLIIFLIIACGIFSYAQTSVPIPKITIGVDGAENPDEVATSLQILFLLTVITLAPAILVMMTSFTRVVIVLSFVRQALGTQQVPSNQLIIGLSLFLTFFIMMPVGSKINQEALQPYFAGDINRQTAFQNGLQPIRAFMKRQTRDADLGLFISLTQGEKPTNFSEVSTLALVPAFVISELRTAFVAAFLIYIPFLVIDMVIASTLMSMGMLMLPPIMISLPFKILLFIAVDGWHLITRGLLESYL